MIKIKQIRRTFDSNTYSPTIIAEVSIPVEPIQDNTLYNKEELSEFYRKFGEDFFSQLKELIANGPK